MVFRQSLNSKILTVWPWKWRSRTLTICLKFKDLKFLVGIQMHLKNDQQSSVVICKNNGFSNIWYWIWSRSLLMICLEMFSSYFVKVHMSTKIDCCSWSTKIDCCSWSTNIDCCSWWYFDADRRTYGQTDILNLFFSFVGMVQKQEQLDGGCRTHWGKSTGSPWWSFSC